MLRGASDACVVHVVDVRDGEALEMLSRTTQVVARVGADQLLLVLAPERGDEVIWSAALAAEVKALRYAPSLFGKVRALRAELLRLSRERALLAVHLHGVGPCLAGSRALRGVPFTARVLYSPHLAYRSPSWTRALVGRLLPQTQLADCAALTTSPAEGELLSRLLKRSAEVLPLAASAAFFAAQRRPGTRPWVLAGGCAAQAAPGVARMSVLLNGRGARVPISWLGAAEGRARAPLEAAGIPVLAPPDDAEKAQTLSRASLFIHIAADDRPLLLVAQAMAAAVPCLVSDTSSHRTLVRHGETGFICTSERDFLEKLILLLRDPSERDRIGDAARADAERRFTTRHFDRAVLRAYGFSGAAALQSARLAAAPWPPVSTHRI